MDTPIFCNPPPTVIVNSGNRFTGLAGNGAASSSAQQRQPIAEAGSFKSMTIGLAAPLTTGTLVVTLQVGTGGAVPSDTAMTVSFAAGDQFKTYNATSIAVLAGDEIDIKWTPSGTPDISNAVAASLVFEATTTGKSVIFASHSATASATFLAPGSAPLNGTELSVTVVAPTNGVISKIYARRSVVPGAGTSATYTLRVGAGGGAMANSALAVTISDSNFTNSATGSVSISAGDFLSIGVTISGTPASAIGLVCLDWAPTIDGEALLFSAANTGASSAADRFIMVNGQVPTATESDNYNVAPLAFTARKMYLRTTTAPGTASSGKSWTNALMVGGAASALTAQVLETATQANDTTHSVSVAANDLIDTRIRPASTPVAYSGMGISMVAFTGSVAAPRMLSLLGVG